MSSVQHKLCYLPQQRLLEEASQASGNAERLLSLLSQAEANKKVYKQSCLTPGMQPTGTWTQRSLKAEGWTAGNTSGLFAHSS